MKRIFISYSHDDVNYKEELVKQLRHLENFGVSFWNDRYLPIGVEWEREIKDALKQADAAIFLVSNPFLASEFCRDKEIPELLGNAKREEFLSTLFSSMIVTGIYMIG